MKRCSFFVQSVWNKVILEIPDGISSSGITIDERWKESKSSSNQTEKSRRIRFRNRRHRRNSCDGQKHYQDSDLRIDFVHRQNHQKRRSDSGLDSDETLLHRIGCAVRQASHRDRESAEPEYRKNDNFSRTFRVLALSLLGEIRRNGSCHLADARSTLTTIPFLKASSFFEIRRKKSVSTNEQAFSDGVVQYWSVRTYQCLYVDGKWTAHYVGMFHAIFTDNGEQFPGYLIRYVNFPR